MTSSWTANAPSIPRAPSASESTGSTPRSANDLSIRPFAAPFGGADQFRLERPDVLRLRALLALLGVVGDLRALAERAVAVSLDRAVMDEEVLAAVVRCYEAEALLVREPLHGSLRHVYYLHGVECCERGGALRHRRALQDLAPDGRPVSATVAAATSIGMGISPCRAAWRPAPRPPPRTRQPEVEACG